MLYHAAEVMLSAIIGNIGAFTGYSPAAFS